MHCLLYPGSFDPPTIGHLDLIQRAARLCDRLVVAVLTSGEKEAFLTPDQRKTLLSLAVEGLSETCSIEVVTYPGLAVDLYRQVGAEAAVRGLRHAGDFLYEHDMAQVNHSLLAAYETIFLPARPDLAHVSSSLVREMNRLNKDFLPWIPAPAREATLAYVAGKTH